VWLPNLHTPPHVATFDLQPEDRVRCQAARGPFFPVNPGIILQIQTFSAQPTITRMSKVTRRDVIPTQIATKGECGKYYYFKVKTNPWNNIVYRRCLRNSRSNGLVSYSGTGDTFLLPAECPDQEAAAAM